MYSNFNLGWMADYVGFYRRNPMSKSPGKYYPKNLDEYVSMALTKEVGNQYVISYTLRILYDNPDKCTIGLMQIISYITSNGVISDSIRIVSDASPYTTFLLISLKNINGNIAWDCDIVFNPYKDEINGKPLTEHKTLVEYKASYKDVEKFNKSDNIIGKIDWIYSTFGKVCIQMPIWDTNKKFNQITAVRASAL